MPSAVLLSVEFAVEKNEAGTELTWKMCGMTLAQTRNKRYRLIHPFAHANFNQQPTISETSRSGVFKITDLDNSAAFSDTGWEFAGSSPVASNMSRVADQVVHHLSSSHTALSATGEHKNMFCPRAIACDISLFVARRLYLLFKTISCRLGLSTFKPFSQSGGVRLFCFFGLQGANVVK